MKTLYAIILTSTLITLASCATTQVAPVELSCYPKPSLPKLSQNQIEHLLNRLDVFKILQTREELLENWAVTNCDIIEATKQ